MNLGFLKNHKTEGVESVPILGDVKDECGLEKIIECLLRVLPNAASLRIGI